MRHGALLGALLGAGTVCFGVDFDRRRAPGAERQVHFGRRHWQQHADRRGDLRALYQRADGDYVVFQSEASNLGSGDTNGYSDIFLWSAATGKLTNITRGLAPVSNPNNGNVNADVAYNGNDNAIIVFETARNLVAADTSNGTDVYAYNFKTRELQLVSSKADGSDASA